MKADILKEIKGGIDTMVDARNKEFEDRKRRELNIAIFNLAEHNHENGFDNKKCDEAEHNHENGFDNKKCDENDVRAICRSLGVEGLEIVTHYRLGKKNENKIRPLKVILGNKAQRKTLLANTKTLPDKVSPEYSKVIIVRDLTTTQREEKRKQVQAGDKIKHKCRVLLPAAVDL